MGKSYFEILFENKDRFKDFQHKQESAATITLMGPTSSAKSTLITELLPPESNKLMSRNIGNTAQTTLIPTRLMLNNRFGKYQILITCRKKGSKHNYPDFLESLKTVFTDLIYENRDELEDIDEFIIEEHIIEKILNPVNRAFHVHRFAEKYGLVLELTNLLQEIYKLVSLDPNNIKHEADKTFREVRKKKTTAKKKDVYEQLIDYRMGCLSTHINRLATWYEKLENEILKSLEDFWSDKNNLIFLADLENKDIFTIDMGSLIYNVGNAEKAAELVEKLYDKDSPYSLVFDEIMYATCPSDGFIKVFSKDYPERTVKINVLDTVGLTQSSQDEDIISLNMDEILNRKSDALLFLCASSEQPTVYDTCIKLLKEKKQKLSNKIVVVCRTKADITITNIMRNNWKRDQGTNQLEYQYNGKNYVKEAINSYKEDQINDAPLGENKLGFESNSEIKYISLTPDATKEMEKHLDGELSVGKVFDILFEIVSRVDKMYNRSDNLWLQSKSLNHYPVNVTFSGEPLTRTIAWALVVNDSRNGNQYKKYIQLNGIYHGRSVNCFRTKLSYGEGHVTKASYYDNFELKITFMVRRWLRETIPQKELLSDFGISFDYLETDLPELRKQKLNDDFMRSLYDNWDQIIANCAKALSYDCLCSDFEKCYYAGYSWSDSFRKSLGVINRKFSNENYWREHLPNLLIQYSNELLRKLYIFD